SSVMWDGRETLPGQSIHFDLSDQANSATLGHAQAAQSLTDEQRAHIVDFETSLFTAQVLDHSASRLKAEGAKGGPVDLAAQDFYVGINDLFGDSKTGALFDPAVFNLFDAWADRGGEGIDAARASVARGEALFNQKPINISGVSGINDEPGFGAPAIVAGTCT